MNDKIFLDKHFGCNYIITNLRNNSFLKEIALLHPYEILNEKTVIWDKLHSLCFNNILQRIIPIYTSSIEIENTNSYFNITQKDFAKLRAEIIKIAKENNNDLSLTEMYKEDKMLNTFTHFHFYNSGKKHISGIERHQSFKVLGINTNTKTYTWLCGGNYRFDEIRTLNSLNFSNIQQMGYWEDGSFFIHFSLLVKKPDVFNTFYLEKN